MQRKISDVENKLLLLFSINQLGNVTNLQLLQFMVDNDLMDYITLQLALGELIEAGQLSLTTHTLGELYSLTDKGKEALRLFERRVPNSRRVAIRSRAVQWRARFFREKTLLADFQKLEENDYLLTLQLLENNLSLMCLDLHLPARNMADLFSRRWPDRAQDIYQGIVAKLSNGYLPNAQYPPLPAFARWEPQLKGEPLLFLTYDPDGKGTFQVSLPVADAHLASCFALQWEKEGATILNLVITCLAREK